MKKTYTKPTSSVVSIPRMQLLAGSEQVPIDPDKPTDEALSRSFDFSWEDFEEDN
jgi:hypothetical protein